MKNTILAIKGHVTRYKEVIELLEMLGGENRERHNGNNPNVAYYISHNYIIACDGVPNIYPNIYKCEVYTLEEFLEKFPHKVGDKVVAYCEGILAQFTIQNMRWNCELNKVEYKICSSWLDTSVISPYKEETVEERKYADLRLDADQDDKLATEATIDDDKITPPANYLIGKITKVDNGVLVEFVKKRPQYPETYKECCKMLGFGNKGFNETFVYTEYNKDLLQSLQNLIICRDAYWKIAGKQMGLTEPWSPNWSLQDYKYVIVNKAGVIQMNEVSHYSRVLAFPAEEMRDAFYDNFKELIEQCKELL